MSLVHPIDRLSNSALTLILWCSSQAEHY